MKEVPCPSEPLYKTVGLQHESRSPDDEGQVRDEGAAAMAARARPRQAPAAQSGKAGDDVSRKLMVENIRDATGASEEEVLHMLIECNNDMNETTSRLIDSAPTARARLPCSSAIARHGLTVGWRADPYCLFMSKKDKKKKVGFC